MARKRYADEDILNPLHEIELKLREVDVIPVAARQQVWQARRPHRDAVDCSVTGFVERKVLRDIAPDIGKPYS
jgi:hypothetical protein